MKLRKSLRRTARHAAYRALETLESRILMSTYYVSPSGSDSAAGSQAAPWKTLQQAADSVQAGDTVNVLAGSYAGFTVTADGTASAPITFLAQPGAKVVSQSALTTAAAIGIDLDHTSYVVVDGFTVDGAAFAGYIGIRSFGGDGSPAVGNVIRNNTLSGFDYCGILASWQDRGVCQGNVISNNRRNGIYYGNSGVDSLIVGNTMTDMGKHGIMLNGDANAGGNGLMLRMTISGNTILGTGRDTSNGDGAGVCAQGLQDSVLSNNLIADTYTDGIRLDQGPDAGGGSDNNSVVNNTINGCGGNCVSIRQGSFNRIFNNVLYNDTTYNPSAPASIKVNYSSYSPEGNSSDYNVMGCGSDGFTFYTFAAWQAGGDDPHSINIGGGTSGTDLRDSFWVNWRAGDYRPKAGGGLVDAGVTTYSSKTAPTTDIEGNARPQGAALDRGAFELVQATTAPAAPTGLAAAAADPFTINLSWTDNSSNESGFLIERSTDGTNFTQVASVSPNVRTYADTGRTTGTTYTYRVRATNSIGNSAYTNTASAVGPAAPTPPAAPSALTATAASSTQINLSWSDNSGNESGFKVERSTDGVNFTQVTVTGANVTTYTNTGLTASTTYTYRVRATNAGGDSAFTAAASATTDAPPATAPAAPSALSATALAANSISLSWTDNSNNETTFRIDRRVVGGTFAQVTTVPANVTTWTDTSLNASTQYQYRVRAQNSVGNSTFTATASATTPALPATAPSAPTGLTAAAVDGSQISLAWSDTSSDETGFVIERQTGGGQFEALTTVNPNVTTYTDAGLAASTQYTYRVRATNAAGDSAWTATASATTTDGITPGGTGDPANITLGTGAAKYVRYTDADGTLATLTYKGLGTVVVHFGGEGLTATVLKGGVLLTGGPANVETVTGTGTTVKSSLLVSGKGGDGAVTVGDVNLDGAFGTLGGKVMDLTGDVTAGGALTSFLARSAGGGVFSAASVGRFSVVGDFADDVLVSTVGSFRSGTVSRGTWSVAGSVLGIGVKGDLSMNLTAGSVRALLAGGNVNNSAFTLTTAAAPNVMALGVMSVRGSIVSSQVNSSGNIGVVHATAMRDSSVTASGGGVQALGAGAGAVVPTGATIGAVSLRMIRGGISFINSSVAADSIGKASLGGIQLANGGVEFGLTAHAIGSVTGVDATTGAKIALKKLATGMDAETMLADQGVTPQDLVIDLV
jgi:fibronectin type 3 domain-containing protein